MKQIKIGTKIYPMATFNTIIVGSGCAAFNAADCLYHYGQKDIALITEGINMGTSRNTGSDKQTYYKISTSGGVPDSIEQMAQSYLVGGSMNGDTALIEASTSAQCFFKLVDIGVPFPRNEYGEYVGYQTDHDSSCRATSCGPLTSNYMTKALEKLVIDKEIPIFDGLRVIEIVKAEENAVGLIAYDSNQQDFVLFCCTNIIYATGGPAGIYACSVYPKSQTGAHGAAFKAGVKGTNLTEWQYGIASIDFRWNLSGSYQQVLPRYISCNQNGNDEREFLLEHFDSQADVLNAVFLKGFQWPFDVAKLDGSSKIDMAIYQETHKKGRKVFLDFTKNPFCTETLNMDLLSKETTEYLKKSKSLGKTPIERLLQMNEKAYRLYLDNGIDLKTDRLAIDICAQHNNGGLQINIWSESNVKHLFICGEAAGVFGVYRPGGSALNSTQVTSLRAAQYIAINYKDSPNENIVVSNAKNQLEQLELLTKKLLQKKDTAHSILENRSHYQSRMSTFGAMYRYNLEQAVSACKSDINRFEDITNAKQADLVQAFVNRDILYTQYAYLSAMLEYRKCGGVSRGSALYEGDLPQNGYDPLFDYTTEITCEFDSFNTTFIKVPVRKFPQNRDLWFETVYHAMEDTKIEVSFFHK